MKWTEAQEKAIRLRGKNILVSAAAGSGKTAVLVERIKTLLLEDGIDLNQILVVTFSNAAAAEMKEKIVRAITDELKKAGLSQEKERFLRRQLNLIYKANISTFHAFAMEIIRRYFHIIQIEPDFKICDEAQKTILQADALEELFAERFQERDAEFLSFLKAYASSKNEKNVKEMILSTYHFIQSIPDSFQWLRENLEDLLSDKAAFERSKVYVRLRENIETKLSLCLQYFKSAEALLEEYGLEKLRVKAAIDLGELQAVYDVSRNGEFDLLIERMNSLGRSFQRLVATKEEKEIYQEIKGMVSAFRDKGKEIFNGLCEQYANRPLEEMIDEIQKTYPYAQILYALTEGFAEIYSEKKREKNWIDFNDIEHYALEILEKEEAASEYRDKFQYIFIDEYQDSNIVQETLIQRIKKENNVFMVGDVKQSIYKFRLAEPELFIEKYELFREQKEKNEKIDLNKNFRSKETIIDGINHIFSKVMQKETTGLAYDEEAALYKGVGYSGELSYPISLHIADDAKIEEELDDAIKEMKRAEIEAYTAVQIIKQAKGKDIYDCKRDCVRTLENKDIVILLRSARTDGPIYFQALMDEGIPAFVDNSDGYFDTVEIQIFLNLLRLIDNKKQDVCLLSVMRSPIFDFTTDEMAEVRIAYKTGAYYDAFAQYSKDGEREALREKCSTALHSLELWSKNAAYMPLESLLWKLIEETGYYQYVGSIPGGIQRQANLRFLVDKAVQYQASQGKGLFSFIRYIEALQEKKVSTAQVRLVGENDDVVRIMTIHKSKGLEFPFVLVGGLAKKFQLGAKSAACTLDKELGLGLHLVDTENHFYRKTLLQYLMEEKKKKEDMAEEIRILYVAFTRAMDELVLLGTVTDIEKTMEKYRMRESGDIESTKCYMDLIFPALSDSDIKIFMHGRSEMSLTKEEADQKKEAVALSLAHGFLMEENAESQTEIQRRLEYVYPYLFANKMKSKYSVSELVKEKLEESLLSVTTVSTSPPQFLQGKKEYSAAEKGTILHRIMEYLPFQEFTVLPETKVSEIRVRISDWISRMVEKEILLEEEALAADIERIAVFFFSEIGKRACRAKELYKEVSFNLKKEKESEEIIIQGTIDCYFLEKGNYILLDYKSNAVHGGEESLAQIKKQYEIQLALYKEALEKIKGIQVKEMYLYLFSLGHEIKV